MSQRVAAIGMVDVGKRYGEHGRFAVEGVSFEVAASQVLGLVGPNGAGKTTTMLMLAGLLRPTTGVVSILGHEVSAGQGNPVVGLVSSSLGEFDYLTGPELVALYGRMLGVPAPEAQRRAEDLATAFDLGASDQLLPQYSSGMQQKIRIACALIGSPQVLLLDEPFEALDITASAIFSEILRRFAARGGAVLLASHDLRLVERVATHYAILKAGRLQETAPMHTIAPAAGAGAPAAAPALEQRFWDVTGAPEIPDLDWLYPSETR